MQGIIIFYKHIRILAFLRNCSSNLVRFFETYLNIQFQNSLIIANISRRKPEKQNVKANWHISKKQVCGKDEGEVL